MKTAKFFVLTIVVLFAITPGISTYAYTGHIAYVSDRDGQNEIYLMEMDGNNQIRLTDSTYDDICPVFSPNGQKIAFFSNRSGSYRIYTMDWNGTGIQEISNSNCAVGTLAAGRGLAWSPDGQKVLFKPTNSSLATINLDGSGRFVIWDGAINGHDYIQGVEWGPTMDDIYVNAQVSGNGFNQHIFHYAVSTGVWTQITQDDVYPQHSQGPKISPNGLYITFFKRISLEEKNIFTMNLDGSNGTQLTFDESPIINGCPSWVGDTGIVFDSDRSGGSRQIWIMDSTGANLQNVTRRRQ